MKRVLLLFFLLPGLFTLRAATAPCPISRAASWQGHVWLLCDEEQLLISSDRGNSWQMVKLPPDVRYRDIAFLDEKRGFIVGDGGTLLATSDGGRTWQPVTVPVKDNLTSLCFVGELGWVAGWNGVILHTADGGKTWELQKSGVTQGLEAIYFVDPDHGWAAGWSGTIVRTSDGGKRWEKSGTIMSFWSISALYFRDVNNGWAVGFGGQILRTRDGGLNWEQQPSPVRTRLTSITFDESGRGYITAGNELLASEDGGQSWRSVPLKEVLFLQQALRVGNTLWAVGRFGVLEGSPTSLEFRSLASLPKRTPAGS